MNYIKLKLKQYRDRLLYGAKATSASYVSYLRLRGMKIGEYTTIFDPPNTIIDETRPWLIEIGNDVKITSGVIILTHGYDWSVLRGKYGAILGSSGKVKIGDNVFIGMRSIILKGVSIGNNCIIGACSLVNKDVPDNCVVAGNPARVICSLDDYFQKRKAAQMNEAYEMVTEFYHTYEVEPDINLFSEFFWLFSDENNDIESLPDAWKKHILDTTNRETVLKMYKSNNKKYDNMDDFLNSIVKKNIEE